MESECGVPIADIAMVTAVVGAIVVVLFLVLIGGLLWLDKKIGY